MIAMQDITKTYHLGEVKVPILKGIDLSIKEGEYVSIMGASGSGKSTLMNIVGCLDRATEGHYIFEGEDLTTFSNDELAYVRNQRIGFVFQQFNLLPRATALENVMLPMIYANVPKSERRERATQALVQVGLAERLQNRPNQLSGGQRQRVALARALAIEPKVLLLDEPFGALDIKVRKDLRNWLRRLHEQVPITTMFVTHDHQEALEVANEIVLFDQGRISHLGNPQDVYKQLTLNLMYK